MRATTFWTRASYGGRAANASRQSQGRRRRSGRVPLTLRARGTTGLTTAVWKLKPRLEDAELLQGGQVGEAGFQGCTISIQGSAPGGLGAAAQFGCGSRHHLVLRVSWALALTQVT